jgi:hypothetical protein
MNLCCYNRCHGNALAVIDREEADKGFWTLWNSILPAMYRYCHTMLHSFMTSI